MRQLLSKTGKRLKYYSKFYIPFNLKYKPTGVYPTIREFLDNNPDDGSYQEIFPAFLSRINVDEDFYQACPLYLKPEVEIEQPPTYLLTIQNGRVIAGTLGRNIAYISPDNRLIGEVSFQWSNGKILSPEKNKILKHMHFDPPKIYEGAVFSMLSGAAGAFNYFHWFIDTFPKLYLAKMAGKLQSIDWFLVPSYEYSFQKEYLSLMGIDDDRIIKGNEKQHILAGQLIVPSATRGAGIHIPGWIPQFYREEILPKLSPGVHGQRIYISRNDSPKRRTLNEDQLIPVLEKYGFQVHSLNGKSTREQAQLFSSASFIVAPHGAGLANLVYCNPGTKVIEYFPGGYVKHTYYDLSNKCGLDYRYIIFDKDKEADNAVEGQKIHITVDVERIERVISGMLNR